MKDSSKPFYFRLDPAKLLSALIQIPEDQRGEWITKVAIELATGSPTLEFTVTLFNEVEEFKNKISERNRNAGLVSAKKRKQVSTSVEHVLTDVERMSTKPNPVAVAVTEAITIKPKITNFCSTKVERDADFETFWLSYPKKIGKGDARKSWSKLKPSAVLQQIISEAIEKQKRSQQWQKSAGQFIPNPSTWLNQQRWEDDLTESVPFKTDKQLESERIYREQMAWAEWGQKNAIN